MKNVCSDLTKLAQLMSTLTSGKTVNIKTSNNENVENGSHSALQDEQTRRELKAAAKPGLNPVPETCQKLYEGSWPENILRNRSPEQAAEVLVKILAAGHANSLAHTSVDIIIIQDNMTW